jgi:hypothetical protein
MKKTFLKKLISVSGTAAAVLILGLNSPAGFAQSNSGSSAGARAGGGSLGSSLSDLKGFDRSVFDYHFSRADRELRPDRWISEARRGMGLALHAWELFAADFYDNPLLLEGAKKQLEEWSAAELEERFTRWLAGRFFGEAAESAVMLISSSLGETNTNLLYHLDAEGNIIYDSNTGDPSAVRPGEAGREFPHDLALWRGMAEQNIKNGLDALEAGIAGMYPELSAYIPPEMRESLGSKITAAGSAFSAVTRKEFENLAAREERNFTSRRTGDVWSLRKKSDDEAARSLTARLVAEAEAACAGGINGLAGRIEAASAGGGDLVLMGKEWLEMYREQFDRGLKAWEQAEERFFIRRIEWEQEAGRLFSSGEESWLTAFNQFEEERKKWELKTKELFESGEAIFKNASVNLEKSIAEAKIEFEYNSRLRTDAGTARAKAFIDMYLTCASGAAAARENMVFWLKQYGSGNKMDPAAPSFNAWLAGEIQKRGAMNAKDAGAVTEIKKSFDLYNSYLSKAKDAREKLVADYNGLIGSGALKDILSDDVSSEDFSLDEYQLALIKARALVTYWERRTAIAGAVSAYAEDLTAGRTTNAEGVQAWETAKAAYNQTLARYEDELRSLQAAGADLREKQAVLDVLGSEMSGAEEALNTLNLEYSTFIAANIVNRENYMLVEFNARYSDLLAEYRLLMRTGEGAAYKTALEYALELGIARQNETEEELRSIMINGDGGDMLSLAALREAVESAQSPAAGSEAEFALKVRLSGLELLNARTGADWYCKVKDTVLPDSEKAKFAGRKLGEHLAADAENSFQTLLEQRITLEADALDRFLNGNSGGESVSQLCLADQAGAEKGLEVLRQLGEQLRLGEGYFTNDDEKDEIIRWFIAGGSFFGDSGAFIAEALADYRFNMELLELYENFGNAASFKVKEAWQDTIQDMGALFASYGLDTSDSSLPDIQNVYAALTARPGDFVHKYRPISP